MIGPTDLPNQQLHYSISTLSHNNKLELQWVPAHFDIAGNETAHRLAKAAANLPQFHFSTSYRQVKTLLKQTLDPRLKKKKKKKKKKRPD